MKCLIWIFGVTVTLAFAPPAFAAEGAQPLTRADCEEAGKTWDDTANVCGENAAENKKAAPKSREQKEEKRASAKQSDEEPIGVR